VNLLRSLRLPGIELYLAEDDSQYGEMISDKIKREIDVSDAFVVFLTKKGSESASVNQEVGYAIKAGKLVIAAVEHGATVGVLIQGVQVIHFSVDKIEDAVKKIIGFVRPKSESKKKRVLWIIGGIVAFVVVAILGLLLWFFFIRKKR